MRLVKAVLVAGLYPNVARVDGSGGKGADAKKPKLITRTADGKSGACERMPRWGRADMFESPTDQPFCASSRNVFLKLRHAAQPGFLHDEISPVEEGLTSSKRS